MPVVDVLVPVLGRPAAAGPFMDSLRTTIGLTELTVTALAEPDDYDTVDAWREAGAVVHPVDDPSFSAKVNAGYRLTRSPWIFFVGDDCRFHPHWLTEALRVAQATGAKVIGTNDLGPGADDNFSPHILIERRYIDEQGASWDGPGIVLHEGYRLSYVDIETCRVAQQRGVWAMAMGSVVEHFHHYWGKAEDDDTYRIGRSFYEADAKTWQARFEQFGAGGA